MQKWGENIFKPTTGNESLHQDSNDNGVRTVNFATSKNLVVKRGRCSHTETFIRTPGPLLMGRLNQIDHILIDRRWHSSVLHVRGFSGAECDTYNYMVVSKVRERLA
jgi:hypothetical protein